MSTERQLKAREFVTDAQAERMADAYNLGIKADALREFADHLDAIDRYVPMTARTIAADARVKAADLDAKAEALATTDAPPAPAAEHVEPSTEQQIRAVQAWMALDLHTALGLPVDHGADVEHQGRRSWADWWAELLHHVRVLAPTAEPAPEPTEAPTDTPDEVAELYKVLALAYGALMATTGCPNYSEHGPDEEEHCEDCRAAEAVSEAIAAINAVAPDLEQGAEPAPEPTTEQHVHYEVQTRFRGRWQTVTSAADLEDAREFVAISDCDDRIIRVTREVVEPQPAPEPTDEQRHAERIIRNAAEEASDWGGIGEALEEEYERLGQDEGDQLRGRVADLIDSAVITVSWLADTTPEGDR